MQDDKQRFRFDCPGEKWHNRPSIQPTIRRQPLQTALATEAAFLVAAERTRRIELVVGIRPNHAGSQLEEFLPLRLERGEGRGEVSNFSTANLR